MRPMNRIEPVGPAAAYKTYTIDSPRDTTERAACEQVGCGAYRNGWRSIIDERTDLGRAQAEYIRTRSRRTFREQRAGDGMTCFIFESGQRCFTDHKTRPETYAVHLGDWRQNFGTVRAHVRAADWVDDFGEHQLRIADRIEKG